MSYYLGIDPAWRTFAYCVLDEDNKPVRYGQLDPKELPIGSVPSVMKDEIALDIEGVCIERYVTFKGVRTNPENILMIIGQLQYWCFRHGLEPMMLRSMDWKGALVKHLRKKGFENPSDTLDKEFSLAAAEFITGVKFKTDHIADAACLAYLARMRG